MSQQLALQSLRRRLFLKIIGLASLFIPLLVISTAHSQEYQTLGVGRPIERELAGGQAHSFQISLAASQFLDAVVEQKGIDVVVTLFGPDGKGLIEVDSPNGTQGPEPVKWITAEAGNYRLEVRSLEKEAKAGRYEVTIVGVRVATAEDQLIVEALRLQGEAAALQFQGKYAEAIPRVERALALREKSSNSNKLDIADLLNTLALLCRYNGDLKRAEPLYKRALEIYENAVGPEHLLVADVLSNLATLCDLIGEYSRSELLHQRALAIREKLLSPNHPDIAISLNNLAELYHTKGDYARAEPLHRRALAIFEEVLGPENSNVAYSLNNLARLYQDRGDYSQAAPLFKRALAISEKALGPDHPNVALSFDNLASLYEDKGDYSQAELLFKRALAISEKALGPDHPNVARSLNNLAELYYRKSDYTLAELLYKRALAIREKSLGPDHPDVAYSLGSLAELYRVKGDYTRAEPFHQRALVILEKAFGPNHPSVAQALNNLAELYHIKSDYVRAEPLHRRALDILEKALGPDHPNVAYALNNLAVLYHDKEEYIQAESFYQRALKLWEEALGPDHPNVAQSLNNLALLYQTKGDNIKALSLFQRALAIREKALGPNHPDVAQSLNNLVSLYLSTGDAAQALASQRRAAEVTEHNLSRNLATGSERQILSYLYLSAGETNQILSLNSRLMPNNQQALRLAIITILRRKGRGLDVISNTITAARQRAEPQDQLILDQLAEARTQLATLTLRGPKDNQLASYRAQLNHLEEQIDKLEAAINERGFAFWATTQPITIEAIQAAIPAEAALVEFAIYRPYNAKTRKLDSARYAVYELTHEGEPRWVELGEAAAIDRNVTALRQALRDPQRSDVNRLARTLDDQVMRPVRALVGNTRHLLISPDGALNLIPFAALIDEYGSYLVVRYEFTYLTSGRDLLRLQIPRQSKGEPLIVADPAFGPMPGVGARLASNTGPTSRHRQARGPITDFSQAYFEPLPETGREAQAIKFMLPNATVLTKEQATETVLKKVSAPSILHIATHGYFLQDGETGQEKTRGLRSLLSSSAISDLRSGNLAIKIENPLLRSGLALAGINLHKTSDDDGALTALEVSGMNLWGTKLVVLSACDTGVGEVKNREGVYGLRRALVLAGSETQVMSLWPVSDYLTRQWMTSYYTSLTQGQGRSEALRQVQLKMLKSKDHRHPFYWASFIQSGEWASLDGKR